jgi:hypothetical protein
MAKFDGIADDDGTACLVDDFEAAVMFECRSYVISFVTAEIP